MINDTTTAPVFLIIDDDETFSAMLARSLHRQGFETVVAHTGEQALALNRQHQPEHASLDLKLGQDSGLTLIEPLHQDNGGLDIVVLTGYSSIATAVEAVKLGALDYLCKPASSADILAAFKKKDANPQVALAQSPPSVDRLEWEHIQRVLNEQEGNISATARALGMHRRTLQRKLQKRPVRQ
jgi:two-component system response regulator RegA